MAPPFDHVPIELTTLNPESQGRDVLFIHGAWHGAWCWGQLAQNAADAGHRVHLLSLPGHGAEPWPLPAATTLPHYAAYAARAAASLGRPVLVGHSMGGWITQKILEAVDLPAALLGPLPGSGLPLSRLVRMTLDYPIRMCRPFVGQPLAIEGPTMARKLFWPEMPDAEVPGYLARLVPEPPMVVLGMGLGLHRADPPMGRAPRILIAGQNDYFMPTAAMAKLAHGLGARYVELPGLPHNFWLGRGLEETSMALLEFLDQATA